MDADLWDRHFDRAEQMREWQREIEQRDAEELTLRERLYDKGDAFHCWPCECGGNPACARCNPYEITDPKHPRHYEVLADIWDSRPGK